MIGRMRRGLAMAISGAMLGATLLAGSAAVSADGGADCIYGTTCANTVRATEVLERGTVNPDTGDVMQDVSGALRVDDTRAPAPDAGE